MHRTPLLTFSILVLIIYGLLASAVLGQATPSGELDVTRCWTYPLVDGSAEELSSDDGRLFLGLRGGNIEALSTEGKKLWASEFGGEVSSNILALDSGLFLVTSSVSSDTSKPGGSLLRSVSKETGITSWTMKLPDAQRHYLGAFNGSVIVVSEGGFIQSVDAKAGVLKWRREIADGFAAEPAFDDGRIIVATAARQIFALSLASGSIVWMRKTPYAITALTETHTGQIIVGDERGNVSFLVNDNEKPYWKFKSGGEISAVLGIVDHVLVTSHDNFVYFLVARNGGLVWKKRLRGRISQISIYRDRFALITSFEGHGVVITDLTNGKVAGQMIFSDYENLIYPPVAANGMISILTNKAVYAYSLNGCSINKNGGPGK